jgi:hypothetical protein
MRFSAHNKSSGVLEVNKKLFQDIDSPFFAHALAAVLEKWLTLCRNSFVDKIMMWRLKFMVSNKTAAAYRKLLAQQYAEQFN